ncbi:MAG: hypothetical protein C4291_13225 [Candidatus Dadabacteria bacterium]
MKNTKTPGLIILILSALGIALSGYLTYLYYAKAQAAFCTVGSGCDTVRESPYSIILGVPVSVFGVIGYLSILILSLVSISYGRAKWLLLYFLSLVGFAFSAYLTYIELFVIKAICPYCVASAFIITGILITLIIGKPDPLPRSSFKFALISGVLVLPVLLVSVSLQSKGLRAGSEDTWRVGLAKHLAEVGATMYGAYWCHHCMEQKGLFGDAFKYIKYVECDPGGERANLALCYEKGIKVYPTWEIRGNFYTGVRSLEELSDLSGYKEIK